MVIRRCLGGMYEGQDAKWGSSAQEDVLRGPVRETTGRIRPWDDPWKRSKSGWLISTFQK